MKVEQHFLLPIVPLRISQGDRLSDSFVLLHKFGHRMCLACDLVCLVGSLGPGVLEASVYEKLFLSRALSFKLLKSGGGVKWGGE